MALIKTLDFNLFKKDRYAFSMQVRECLMETGFFLLENHPIDTLLIDNNKKIFEKFFKEMTLEERMQYTTPDTFYHKGYTPMQIETGEFANTADYKHFFQVKGDGNDYEVRELPELKNLSEQMFHQFNNLYKNLMQAVALSLGLRVDYFDKQLGNSLMRHIHYPEHNTPVVNDEEVTTGGNLVSMCASKHTDINSLTLLFATEPGLELWFKDKWVPVISDASKLIINTGDMLQHHTGGLYKSGMHRVVCQPGVERTSCPFFGHRTDNQSIVPLNWDILTPDQRNKFPYQTEGEFLKVRLDQILKNK